MKRLLICLSFTVIASSNPLAALAQPRPTLQNLTDGDYVFKKGSKPEYVVFRKTGSIIIGESFSYPSDNGYCFRGIARGTAVVDATIEQLDDGGRQSQPPTYIDGQTISLEGYRSIGLGQRPRGTEFSFKRCLEVMNKQIKQYSWQSIIKKDTRAPISH